MQEKYCPKGKINLKELNENCLIEAEFLDLQGDVVLPSYALLQQLPGGVNHVQHLGHRKLLLCTKNVDFMFLCGGHVLFTVKDGNLQEFHGAPHFAQTCSNITKSRNLEPEDEGG